MFASDGDGFGAVFDDPQDAVDAAVAAQRALAAEPWPDDLRLRVTDGTGDRDGRASATASYLGPVPNRAARIMAAAHGGQVLVGARTAALLDGADLVDLGDHRLPDLPRAERLFQVIVDGAPSQFPAPRATRRAPRQPADADHEPHRPRADPRRPRSSWCGPPAGDPHRRRRCRQDTSRRSRWARRSPTSTPTASGWSSSQRSPTPAAVPDAIATTLGITPQAGTPVVQTLADALSGRRALVVLDNCEHVVDAVAETVARAARADARRCACSRPRAKPSTFRVSNDGWCCRSPSTEASARPR